MVIRAVSLGETEQQALRLPSLLLLAVDPELKRAAARDSGAGVRIDFLGGGHCN
jgi:hypothetical protein